MAAVRPSLPQTGLNPTSLVEPIVQQLLATGMAAGLQYMGSEAALSKFFGFTVDADLCR